MLATQPTTAISIQEEADTYDYTCRGDMCIRNERKTVHIIPEDTDILVRALHRRPKHCDKTSIIMATGKYC